MSIHTQTESQSSTDSRPTPEPTSESAERRDAADDGDDEPADSWVQRCRRSFSTTDTRRLRNLTDDENEAMPNPE